MPVPFGFGISDFIAVGGLIAKVVQELKERQVAFFKNGPFVSSY
jgi:hypothetical protein